MGLGSRGIPHPIPSCEDTAGSRPPSDTNIYGVFVIEAQMHSDTSGIDYCVSCEVEIYTHFFFI